MRKLFIVLIVACVAFAGYQMFADDSSEVGGSFVDPTDGNAGDPSFTSYVLPAHRNMYEQLSSVEKEIYRGIRDTLAAGKFEAVFENVDWDVYKEALHRAYQGVYYDFPEFFWLNHAWQAKAYSTDGALKNVVMEIDCYEYWRYTSNKDAHVNAVIDEARRIASLASTMKTDYEKVKFVHDYLVVSAEYDYVCLEEIDKSHQRASSQQSHTVYGALINKVCVCDGYAKAAQLILSMVGVDCEYSQGTAGGGHAWNYVVLDGDEYWMDVTWDENETENDEGELYAPYGSCYNYFCVDDATLYETHTPEDHFEIPVCDSLTYNFFHYENSYLEEYSFEAFCRATANQSGAQILHVKFASHAELKEALEDLFEKDRYKEVPELKGRSFRYQHPKGEDGKQVISILLP